MGSSKAVARRDRAADTVIGFVLVTGISILMISVVMLVGAPALEQVQSRQQMDAMVASYQRLDRGVSTLLSGAPAGTTPSWQVSMADGSLSVDDGGDQLWGYVVNKHGGQNDYRFWFGEYADGDDEFRVQYEGEEAIGSDDLEIRITRWKAGEEVGSERIPRSDTPALTTGDDFLVPGSNGDIWPLGGHTTQIEFLDLSNDEGDEHVAEAWFIDGGTVEWKLSSGGSMKRLLYQNTAIVADLDKGQVLHNTPRLRAPDDDGQKREVFIRVVSIEGAVAVGGRSTSEILLSSEGNHDRFSSGNVTQVQLYPPTDMTTAWQRHLTNEAAGFVYEWTDTDDQGTKDHADVLTGDEGVAHLGHLPGDDDLSASLIQTEIAMSRSGGG